MSWRCGVHHQSPALSDASRFTPHVLPGANRPRVTLPCLNPKSSLGNFGDSKRDMFFVGAALAAKLVANRVVIAAKPLLQMRVPLMGYPD